jgi:hypothetical protein
MDQAQTKERKCSVESIRTEIQNCKECLNRTGNCSFELVVRQTEFVKQFAREKIFRESARELVSAEIDFGNFRPILYIRN